MIKATEKYLSDIEALVEKRKREILDAPDNMTVTGASYYLSADGCDENDGKSPDNAWKTLGRLNNAELDPGDGVFLRRGDTFRGMIRTKPGVTYAAYGSGDKPKLYSGDKNLADPALWSLHDSEHNIWKLNEKILDCGTLVFNGGEAHCLKLIPSYINGRFVCRDDESRDFVMADEMKNDLDMVWFYDERTTTTPSKGQDFPIPLLDLESLGELYLRCDKGNPGEVYRDIEALTRRHMMCVGKNENVTIDNLCIKYVGMHGISAGGHSVGLHVTNCELGWIGGCIQHYAGTDPNYPEGGRGTVTRFGNAIEIYGGCEDYIARNNYIYQVYDAGITHQVTTGGKKFTMTDIHYENNLIEYCVYAIEYFLEKTKGDTESYIDGCEMCGNILRYSGFGWGQQRHNIHTPAHIKGWSYENTARNYKVHHNIFDRAAFRMVHLVAKEEASLPEMHDNTYIQYIGLPLGQYGANGESEPANMVFDETAEMRIAGVMKDKNAVVVHIAR